MKLWRNRKGDDVLKTPDVGLSPRPPVTLPAPPPTESLSSWRAKALAVLRDPDAEPEMVQGAVDMMVSFGWSPREAWAYRSRTLAALELAKGEVDSRDVVTTIW